MRATKILITLYGLTLLYFVILPPGSHRPLLPVLILSTLSFFLFAWVHGTLRWGWRRSTLLLVIAFVIGWTMEAIGVRTGWPFGAYHYTPRLQPQLLGVPLPVLMAWYMMTYTSLALIRTSTETLPATWKRRGWEIIAATMALTAWDVIMDPLMVAGGHWVWDQDGAYFGIPVQNYAGWMLTGFLMYMLYTILERRFPAPPLSSQGKHQPLAAYAITWLGNVGVALTRGMGGPAVAGFFAMGGFVILGLVPFIRET